MNTNTFAKSIVHLMIRWPVLLHDFRCPVFGPVVDDGYGLCYNLKRNEIFAGMTCFKSNKKTSIAHLAESLTISLRELKHVLDAAAQRSKL